jgi:hypothetical protein
MKVKKFNEKVENYEFYKIIDKGKEHIWFGKNFIKDKKTMVTVNPKEIEEINPTKTAIKLTNVPPQCIIDNEGKWFVIEPYLGKDVIEIEPA